MIHGGGHITLSRKHVRAAQTNHLIKNGFLPVSLDYRLCPEVNLIDGPMADVRDGLRWAKEKLPHELMKRGIAADSERLVVIGWSTGGHLAMSLGWTAQEANIAPPSAILSFYAPVDFESDHIYRGCGKALPQPSRSLPEIMKSTQRNPITSYSHAQADETNLGWLQPGDARSDLILHMFKAGNGLSLLLNGLPSDANQPLAETPSNDRIAAINTLAQLRRGRYNTPTFIVHGTKDDIAPHSAAERFADELKSRGVRHAFLSLEDMGHVFDINLQCGTESWEKCVAPGYKFLFDSV